MQGAEPITSHTQVTNLSNPLYQQSFITVHRFDRVRNQNKSHES